MYYLKHFLHFIFNHRNHKKKTKLPEENNQQPKKQSALYSLEELDKFTVPHLPDLTNLKIDYDNEEFLHIGHVKAIVESLGKS